MSALNEFISGLPKAELHMHLEGSLEPPQMFKFAKRNNVDIPFKTVDEIRAAYNFTSLQDFLNIYYQGMNVLRTEDDFHELTLAYLQRAHLDNVKHVEVFFDPQGHTVRDIPFSVVIEGILTAFEEAKSKLNISSKLIMCFLRHLNEDDAFKTLKDADPYLDHICGVGLDSSEVGNPPSKFERVFDQAGKLGLKRVAHAGEEGPPDYIFQALDILQIDRIDHGNRAMENPILVKRLGEEKITLTVCPLSNKKLCVVQDMKQHPIGKMLQADIRATINSDDPAYFGGYINDNYLAVSDALGLDSVSLEILAKNSFTGSFLKDREKQSYIDSINQYISGFAATS